MITVPDKLCTTLANGERGLSCGVVTALFDEITTMALMTGDRTLRGSVSVMLSVHVHKQIAPERTVRIKAHARKVGSCLCCCELNRVDGFRYLDRSART